MRTGGHEPVGADGEFRKGFRQRLVFADRCCHVSGIGGGVAGQRSRHPGCRGRAANQAMEIWRGTR